MDYLEASPDAPGASHKPPEVPEAAKPGLASGGKRAPPAGCNRPGALDQPGKEANPGPRLW
jgi:hypothetical protein